MSYVNVADRVGEQLISTAKRVQDLSLNTLSSVTERVANFVPELPQLPFADRLPQPRDIAEKTFGFWEGVLEAQKDYTFRLIDALEPLSGKGDRRTARGRKPHKATAQD
ncbi:MAG: hypothetical protein QOD06_3049 [Candidatus Binatota bacterium]|jgi:hypothetical protein|nr:hypothetical protein [Candidatus Binatota bacterium]